MCDFSKFILGCVEVIGWIDISLGIMVKIYGTMVLSTGATNAGIVLLTIGALWSTSAVTGAVGIHYPHCKRCWLVVSAYLSLAVAAFESVAAFYILFNEEGFFQYLTEYREQLYLSEDAIDVMRDLVPVMFFTLMVLAVVEVIRFYMLVKLRKEMLLESASLTEPLLAMCEYSQTSITTASLKSSPSDGSDSAPLHDADPHWWANDPFDHSQKDMSWAVSL